MNCADPRSGKQCPKPFHGSRSREPARWESTCARGSHVFARGGQHIHHKKLVTAPLVVRGWASSVSTCLPRATHLVVVPRRFLPAKLRIKLPGVDHLFRILVARTYISRPKRRRVHLSFSSFTFPPPSFRPLSPILRRFAPFSNNLTRLGDISLWEQVFRSPFFSPFFLTNVFPMHLPDK